MGFYTWISKLWQKNDAEKKAKNKLLRGLLLLLFSSIGVFSGTTLLIVLSLLGFPVEACAMLFIPVQTIFLVLSYIFVNYVLFPLLPDLIRRWLSDTYYGQLMWHKLQFELKIEEIRELNLLKETKNQLEQEAITKYFREKESIEEEWRFRKAKSLSDDELYRLKQTLHQDLNYRKELAEHSKNLKALESENPESLAKPNDEQLQANRPQLNPANNSDIVSAETKRMKRQRRTTIKRTT